MGEKTAAEIAEEKRLVEAAAAAEKQRLARLTGNVHGDIRAYVEAAIAEAIAPLEKRIAELEG